MPAYEEDSGFQLIASVQPINRIQPTRALRVQQTRPYMGGRKAHPTLTDSDATDSDATEEEELLAEPAVILDISPQAREQAHHLTEEAPDTRPVTKHAVTPVVNRAL